MAHLSPAARLKVRRSRRKTAHWLLGWALTFGGLAVTAAYVDAAVVDRDVFTAAADDLATDPAVRRAAASQLADALVQSGGDPDLARDGVDEIAASLDTERLTVLLVGMRDAALDADVVAPTITWDELTDLPAATFGVPAGVEVRVAPQVPKAPWLASVVPSAVTALLAVAGLLTIVSVAVAVERTTPARTAGRWASVTALLATAVSWLGPWVLGLLGGAPAALGRELLAASAVMLAPFTFGLGVVGAGSWAVGYSTARARSSRIVAATEEAAEAERVAVAATAPPPVPVMSSFAPQVELAYWLRPGHPAVGERYRESEITTALPHDELERLARLTAAAWADPQTAGVDAADALRLLFEDRGNFHQVALFWARFAGQPAAASAVVLAYEDFLLYAAAYADQLQIPEWALIERVGQLGRAVREAGVTGAAARLAGVYADLVAVVGPKARTEADRLEAILSTLVAHTGR